jgi:hypothetical protein
MKSIELGGLVEITAHVLGVDPATARNLIKIPLAESALAAPLRWIR